MKRKRRKVHHLQRSKRRNTSLKKKVRTKEEVMVERKEVTIIKMETNGRNSFSMRIISQNLKVSLL
jgi:hypothetical protein